MDGRGYSETNRSKKEHCFVGENIDDFHIVYGPNLYLAIARQCCPEERTDGYSPRRGIYHCQ